jgi:hypothetical protein
VKNSFRRQETIYEPSIIESRKVRGEINFTIEPEIRVSFFNKDVHKSVAIYNREKKITEVLLYSRRSRVKGKASVIYNADGKPIEINIFGDDRSFRTDKFKPWQAFFFLILDKIEEIAIRFLTVYSLAKHRKFKPAWKCFLYGTTFRQTFIEYDSEQRISEIKRFAVPFEIYGREVFKYDEKGNKSEQISFSGDEISIDEKHEYEYDSKDNWIKKKSLYDFSDLRGKGFPERSVLTYRTIKYF